MNVGGRGRRRGIDCLQTDKWAAVPLSPNSDYIQLQPGIVLSLFQWEMYVFALIVGINLWTSLLGSRQTTDRQRRVSQTATHWHGIILFFSITEYWFLISVIYLYKIHFLDQMSFCEKTKTKTDQTQTNPSNSISWRESRGLAERRRLFNCAFETEFWFMAAVAWEVRLRQTPRSH